MSERPYEVALYGATGFTGALAAHWLVERGARFCIAGRSRSKLERLRDELGHDVPIEVCTSEDPASLRAVAEKSRVLATTVGPYERHGLPVVAAAVEGGCDYVDITGEPGFVSESIARFDGPARDKGLRIVHCCGFDSLPHDLGAWFTVKHLPADAALKVDGFVSSRGGFSGGTWASALNTFRDLKPGKPKRTGSRDGHPARIRAKLHRERALKAWAVPLPTIDPVIVVRSARALRYGSSFEYGHYAKVKTKRYLIGGGLAVGAVVLATKIPGIATWLEAQWPSGSGPDEAAREKGWFRVVFIGQGGGQTVYAEIRGDEDPGYGMTRKWVGESALALAQDRDRLPERFGVLTPVAAMAEALEARMPATGTVLRTISASDL
ncbi:MAG: saccharopine dehydrogenase NADP-binding domain-containing protein [Alphaproteobacteria bacterium]|nr:saccharopine dehydrogenase NADP-binding domain-containing protein [Alphaproteobacteria bacterium]